MAYISNLVTILLLTLGHVHVFFISDDSRDKTACNVPAGFFMGEELATREELGKTFLVYDAHKMCGLLLLTVLVFVIECYNCAPCSHDMHDFSGLLGF